MMQRDLERGIDPLVNPPPPPPPPAPPVTPVLQPAIPPPDWRAEEAVRARRHATAATQDELEPEQPSYPASKRKKTPRLDQVKRWRQL